MEWWKHDTCIYYTYKCKTPWFVAWLICMSRVIDTTIVFQYSDWPNAHILSKFPYCDEYTMLCNPYPILSNQNKLYFSYIYFSEQVKLESVGLVFTQK